MAKSPNTPDSLSEAIARLESIGTKSVNDLKDRLGSDFDQVKDALDVLKPHLEEIKNAAGEKAESAKSEIEEKMKQNPWALIAVVGVLAFFIGWLLSRKNDK